MRGKSGDYTGLVIFVALIAVAVFLSPYVQQPESLFQTSDTVSQIPADAVKVSEKTIGYVKGTGGALTESVSGVCGFDYCLYTGYTSAQENCAYGGSDGGTAILKRGDSFSFGQQHTQTSPSGFTDYGVGYGCTGIRETGYTMPIPTQNTTEATTAQSPVDSGSTVINQEVDNGITIPFIDKTLPLTTSQNSTQENADIKLYIAIAVAAVIIIGIELRSRKGKR